MTLIFYDGFDHYGTADITNKWTAIQFFPTINSSGGRNGGGCLSCNSSSANAYKSFNNFNTIIVGTAFRTSLLLQTSPFLQLRDVTTNQVYLNLNTDGSISIYAGNVLRDTTDAGIVSINVWNYFELKTTIHNSTGTFSFRMNEVELSSVSGIDTQTTANAYVNNIRVWNQTSGADSRFDDLYICDNSGDDNNDFLGDVRAIPLFPNSSGTYAQWQVTGSASNYLAVDDATPDTTTYTYATGSSLKDAFSMDDLSVGDGEIYGIQSLLYARKDEGGAVLIEHIARINGTDYTLGTGSFSIGDSYVYYRTIEELNPDTTGSWTLSDINNIEFGYNRSG